MTPNMNQLSTEALDAMKTAQGSPLPDEIAKYFIQPSSATTGLQAYDLEAPSKKLMPILTPLRNMIPRITNGFGTQANWKAITSINSANQRAGVSEGNRGGVITQTVSEYLAAYRAWGLENYVTFEADLASKGYEDVKALAVSQLLSALMIQEERLDLGGNGSVALGTTPTPSVSTATTGGTIAAATYNVICVALGPQAYLDVAGANNGAIGQAFNSTSTIVPGVLVKTNTDASTDTFGGGSAQQSAAASQITTGSTSTVTATVAAVKGAWGYAWFIGTSGAEKLVALSTINSVVITALPAGGAQLASTLAASDNSTSTLDYDGLFMQAAKTGSNAYWATMANGTAGAGTGLTSDGAGGITEFETMFASFYSKYRLSPTLILMNYQELLNITKKIIGNSGAPLIRFTMDAKQIANGGSLAAGVVIGSYLNKITNQQVPFMVHPNMPAGTILALTDSLPYPLNNVTNVFQKKLRRDYYQLEWPLKSRKYEYGVYADGVLQHYAPFSMGVITNIGNA